MKATILANAEGIIRPLIIRMLSPKSTVKFYSRTRLNFLSILKEEMPSRFYAPPKNLSRELWGIDFRSPLMNSAGMFKNGECYELSFAQGAGAYLGGTGTWNHRLGNKKSGVYLPFTPYPKSHAASNWLGLPNDGDEINSFRAANLKRTGIPIGWSIMGSPDFQGEEKLKHLIKGMRRYEYASVDFIEINESCPNTSHGKPQDDELASRLKYIKENFLDKRTISDTNRLKEIPVIIKFSNDTQIEQIPCLLDLLFELGFDGVNFGNTSTNYQKRKKFIHPKEMALYDFFTTSEEFGVGGGVSGRPLKESSLELAASAVQYVKAGPPSYEFHVIRTGGIDCAQDIIESDRAGISLNQWFTGYFEGFSIHGHGLYKSIYEEYLSLI